MKKTPSFVFLNPKISITLCLQLIFAAGAISQNSSYNANTIPTSGTNSTAFGVGALNNTNTGSNNVVNGYYALNANTSGGNNTANGYHALASNTTGSFNVANGSSSLFNNATGINNTATGTNALFKNSTGNNNVANGFSALWNNISGSNNTAIGYQALLANVTGTNNTALGAGADVSSIGLSNATAIGYNAKAGASNSLVLGGTGVNVGIGTSTPSARLDVRGKLSLANGWDDWISFTQNQTGGRWAIHNNQTASGLHFYYQDPGGVYTFGILSLQNDAKVNIGGVTTPGTYRLYVKDGILTEKVKIAVAGSANWADYVFANDYRLKPLSEIEAFVKENKHLPNVPSAEELVKDGGIDVNQMFAKQMEKIEELTLYTIEQQKQIDELKILVNKLTGNK